MARIRSIKPEYYSSPGIETLEPFARILYIAMWNWADDNGVGTANARELLGFAFPLDEDLTVVDLRRMLDGIRRVFGVEFYTVAGRPYYAIPSWEKHQKFDRRSKGKHPGPEEADTPVDQHEHSPSTESHESPSSTRRDSVAGTGEQGNRGTGEQRKSADADTAPPEPQPVREDVEQICEAIALHVQEQTGKQPAITKKWRDSARLLIDRDGFTLEQITWIIRWVAGHDFWSAVILSAPKLREKFPNLVAQAKRDGTPKVDKAAQMILADRLRREAGTDAPKEIEQ
ncbi:hypothetical protein ACTXM8_10200 [Brachybacterium alimentarium]|uniref:hypothetical protein n=1 Tax=Brachybacterium alimentarium TaxID=47845 RepID=UPI003FD640E2